MPRAVEVKALSGRRIRLRFDDGVEGEIDLSDLSGRGVFIAWDEPGVFESVRVGEHGEICWENDIDLCSDSLWLRLTGSNPSELFPSLAAERESA